VIGFRDGFEGLLEPASYLALNRKNTAGIMAQGGTILGTTNRGHFVAKAGAGDRMAVPRRVIETARRTLDALGIEGLICVGGDGSLSTALQLHQAGIPVVGVPKTIDNDLEATDMTFGFDSAVTCVADALDRLHTTAESHKRVMVTEVMGATPGGSPSTAASPGEPTSSSSPRSPSASTKSPPPSSAATTKGA